MSPLLVIFLTVFIDLLGFGIIIPLLPFYAEHFGASALMVGLLSTSFSVAQFLFAPFWGRLSDRIGRRPVILLGLLGSAVSYALFAMATSLPALFVARTLAGVAGANIPTAQAFIADTTTAETRARGMGIIGAAFGLGFIFGPAIGGFLSHWGYAAPAWFASALSLANFGAAVVLLPESRPAHVGDLSGPGRFEVIRRAVVRPNLPMVLLVYFLVLTSFASFEAMFALYSERRFGFTAATIGYMFAWVGVVLATVQGLLVGRVVKRVGERVVIPAAIMVLAGALGLVPLADSVPVLAAACGLLALGMGFNSPSLLSAISQLADPRDQGSTLGVSQSLGSLARIIGPLWGGWVFDHLGIRFPFYTAGGLMLVACVLSVVVFSRVQPVSVPARP
ncbi:MAG TPA: MFS transporter [Vicinamibacterales bacterium]|nr:MFS transporter [Vicinamibacterales bacterium]